MLLKNDDSQKLEPFGAHLQAFEAAWLSGQRPDWDRFITEIPDGPQGSMPLVLMELTAIDIESRWKCGLDRPVEEYVAREPRLGETPLLLELIAEEFRARSRLTPPTHAEFQQRFPAIQQLVCDRLRQVEKELSDERDLPAAKAFAKALPLIRAVPYPQLLLPYEGYLLEKFIGAGGSGKIYRALQRSSRRHVAVKFLKKSFQADAQAVQRFLTEANLVSKLDNQGIIRVHGVGQTPNNGYFLVMEWLPSGDLHLCMQRGTVSLGDAIRWVRDAAQAIHFAHHQGVIHCDLKPANLLLNEAGSAVVTDFGLARSMDGRSEESLWMGGTAGYMAIEQASSGVGEIGPLTDIYGLGAVLYSLLTGHAPYIGKRPSDILSQLISRKPFPRPSVLRSQIPQELEELCLQCLSHVSSKRPQTAREVAERLQAIATDE